jgi:uncharacterized cofD-like protein/HAD superfamily hydrolase (TIGR01549 family)
MTKKPKIVCIGGGHGLSILLGGLRSCDFDLTAIVTVTDSGRSTGVIRKEFGVLAPGDIRNCLVSLSTTPQLMNELLQYRFDPKTKDSDLKGMSLGNLMLTALTKITGNFDKAVSELGKILKINGRVLPSTLDDTHICAKLADETVVEEEFNVRSIGKSPIKRVFLKHEASVYDDCIHEINDADLIIFGPGGLYTSIIVNLLVSGMSEAINSSSAKKVYIANMMTQPGVSDHLSGLDHIKEIERYLKGPLDYVILNDKRPPQKILERYERAGAKYLSYDRDAIAKRGTRILAADLVDIFRSEEEEWERIDYIRHDPERLAVQINKLIHPPIKGVLLVAGKGERMKPFSLYTSKELISFVGKPLLAHQVDEFVENNIRDIVIICNTDNHAEIKDYFTSHSSEYPDVTFEFVVQSDMNGPANAINYARPYLQDSYCIVKYGDSVAKGNQTHNLLHTFYQDTSVDAVLTLRKVKHASEYGIVRFNNKKEIVEIVEKPQGTPPSHLATVGLFLMDGQKFFSALDEIGVEEVLFPVDYLLRKGACVKSWVMKEHRIDVGRVWNLLEASRFFIETNHQLFRPLHISKQIAADASVDDMTYIGRTARVGSGTEIKRYSSVDGKVGENTVIDNSVVMKGSKIGNNCVIKNSVIGEGSVIKDNFKTKVRSTDLQVYVKDKYVNPTTKQLGLFCGSDVTIAKDLSSEAGKMVFPKKHITTPITKDLLLRMILFDADNTLYQTRRIAKDADTKAFTSIKKKYRSTYKKTISLEEIERQFAQIVDTIKDSNDPQKRERWYSYATLCASLGLDGAEREAYEMFYQTILANIRLYPSVKETLTALDKQYELLVFSEDTRDKLHAKLETCGIHAFFDSIISSEDIGMMKRSKEYYTSVFEKYGIVPAECLVVGDSYERDLKVPRRLGCTTVLFDPEHQSNDDHASVDYVITDHSELQRIVREL